MAKITIDLDDSLMERLAVASRAHNLTVEEWLRAQAEQAARHSAGIENTSHRAILSALDRPVDYYESPRDEMHDRERDRAELYASTRAALLALIDNTQGDMGTQRWSRRALYEP
jgi:hypothetical protein